MCHYMSYIHIICSYSSESAKCSSVFTYNIDQDSSNSQTKDEPNNLVIAYSIEALH